MHGKLVVNKIFSNRYDEITYGSLVRLVEIRMWKSARLRVHMQRIRVRRWK